jgi:PAS domain S-box-containing protein
MSGYIFEFDAFRQALDAHSIVSVTDVKGNILHANDLFCRISGFSHAELLGKNHRIIKSDEHAPEIFKQMWRTIAKGDIWHGEIKNNKKNGGFYWVKTTIMPILNQAGKPYQYISIRTDITDRKMAETNLSNSREKLKIALQAKSDFLSRMNHEIRTPLNGIIGMCDVLGETPLDAEQKEFLDHIKSSSDGLMALLLNLLDFEEVSSGHIVVDATWINIADFMSAIMQHWQQIALGQGLEFECSLNPALPDRLKFDPALLRRIIDELLKNAFKFTISGKVSLAIRPGEHATIITEVKDTGTGISAAARVLIFSPFTQQDSAISRQNDGAGIGLALCKELVTRMGGEISVKSDPGQGSRFRVELPIMQDL